MRYLVCVGLLFCLVFTSFAQEDDLYIDESSGEVPETISNFPTDDDDLGIDDEETSGEIDLPTSTEIEFVEENESTETPEVTTTTLASTTTTTTAVIRIVTEKKEDDTSIEPIDENPVKVVADVDEGTNDEVIGAEAAGATTHFLAAIIVGGCIGLLFAICVIMLLVYRMRKKDEGSYALDYGLDRKPQGNYEYTKGVDSKEFYA